MIERNDRRPVYYFRDWRKHAGLSQPKLAAILGCSKITVSRVERGIRDFTGRYLADFAEAVDAPVWLVLMQPPRKP